MATETASSTIKPDSKSLRYQDISARIGETELPEIVVSTATTTYDGRTIVDARRLLEKPHVRKFIQSVGSKVRLKSGVETKELPTKT